VVGVIVNNESVQEVPAGAKAELVFDQTPFYAEAGGQVGDHGALYDVSGEKVAEVETAFPGVPGLTVHRIATLAPIRVNDVLRAEVAAPLRDATRRNHTATHLLHASLRTVLEDELSREDQLVAAGDFNVAPTDADVWDPAVFVGSTHVTPPERQALADLRALGLHDIVPKPMKGPHPFTYWDYRAGAFPKDMGMRIDLVYASQAVAGRVAGAYVDREARKGHAPSDHAPVVVDLD